MTAFFDTNILVYAQTEDRRSVRANTIIAAGGFISVQVLNEFTNVLRNKFRHDWAEVEDALRDLEDLLPPPLPVTFEIHRRALALARDHGFRIYDALIVAAALEARCDTLYSEDMQHGRQISGLTIVNPFL